MIALMSADFVLLEVMFLSVIDCIVSQIGGTPLASLGHGREYSSRQIRFQLTYSLYCCELFLLSIDYSH